MTTSLAQQLKKLAVPESSIYKQDKKKTSLLFDPKEAASIDRETFYEIGLSGLTDLVNIDNAFAEFKNNLFSLSSKDFERAVQTKDANKKVNKTIKSFLLKLSPYFLLQSSHRALEWLVQRYKIQEYNKDEFMSLILPYHESKIFIRCLQIIKIDDTTSRWHWLEPLQKPGIPLAKPVLFNQCSSNPSMLHFISEMMQDGVNAFGDRAHLLTTLYAFYCSSIVGALEYSKNVTEAHISSILPGLLKTLSSSVEDLRAAGYMITGQLVSKIQLKEKIIMRLINKIYNFTDSLQYEAVLLLQLVYQTQDSFTSITEESLSNTSTGHMKLICLNLNLLVNGGVDVSRFLSAFISGVLCILQDNTESLKRFSKLPEMLISEVSLNSSCAERLIKCVLDSYLEKPSSMPNKVDDSDMEVIEDEDDIGDNIKIQSWYSQFMKSLEQKYPTEFDSVLKKEIQQNTSVSEKRREVLNQVLGFAPKILKKMGDSFLFEKLYHQNSDMRKEAVKYVISDFKNLKKSDPEFVKDIIFDRINDDDPEIVLMVLSLPSESLLAMLTKDVFINQLLSILRKGQKDSFWWDAACLALKFVCSFQECELGPASCFAILPYLFPKDNKAALATLNIAKSPLGTSILSGKDLSKTLKVNEPESVCTTIFNIIENGSWLMNSNTIIRIMNSSLVDGDSNTKLFAMLLLTFSLKHKNSTSEYLTILRETVKFVENVNTVNVKNIPLLSGKTIASLIGSCNDDSVPLQSMIYFLDQMIKKSDVSKLSKPWINFGLDNPDKDFIVELYEIIIDGCSKKSAPVYSSLFQTLFNSSYRTTKNKIEFIANFIYEDRLDTDDPKIAEKRQLLQIRSIKILYVLLQNTKEDISWVYDSDVLMLSVILCLNSPIIQIREYSLNIIKVFLEKSDVSKHHNFILLGELFSRQEEIQLDDEQLPLILYSLLSPDPAVRAVLQKSLQVPMKKALECLIKAVTNVRTPYHVKANLTRILVHINSGEILTLFSKLALEILEDTDNDQNITDIYKSETFANILSKIDSSILSSCLKEESVWELIITSLKKNASTVTLKNKKIHICTLMMQKIDEDLFSILPLDNAQSIVSLIINAGTFCSDSIIISSSSKLIKKIELHSKHFISELIAMQNISYKSNVTAPTRNSKRFQEKVAPPSLMILESVAWKRGVTILEYIQNKKRLQGVEELMPILFGVLKKCLEFEEQSAVEYTKQLLLTCILHCCQKICPTDVEPPKKVSKNLLDIELMVMCIRGTQNPQTHHHALMLLSHAAYMLPDQVLHHIMAIFTFIGSSVLRHDDAYSFQIITRIIETVIPILVQFKGVNDSTEDITDVERRVIPILRIFVDVVLDVPEHRRLPLFKKLLQTLNPDHFIWTFLALIFEGHIMHSHEERSMADPEKRNIGDSEQPIKRVDFAMSLVMEFSAETIMNSCIKLITYLKTLPIDKQDKEINVEAEKCSSVIFSLTSHTAKHLRHFKYTIITFINSVLSSPLFIQQFNSSTDKADMETLYKCFIINILTYIQVISKTADQNVGKPQAKYWKVMLHHSYEILDNVNVLLTPEMFTTVIRGLMGHNLPAVRRKSMELLNTKLQHQATFFAECDKTVLYTLLQPLIDIIANIESDEVPEGINQQELELNQQTALLSLKLLVRLLAQDNPNKFKPVLELITNLTRSSLSGNLMATVVLCLAELCSNLKAHAIAYLPKFMPSLIKILKAQNKADTPELVLLSVITAVYKIVETIPLFLSPYLEKLLFEFSILSAKWEKKDMANDKCSPVVTKLMLIKNKISSTIAPRVLIPVVSQCYNSLLKKEKFDAIGPAMNVLAESFAGVSGPEFSALQQDLTAFFLVALQFRSDYADDKNISAKQMDAIEGHVIKALVALVLKLSESSFRPLYFKIYDWAVRTHSQEHKDRAITFYRLSSCIAENLKGLFVLFAGHFVKNSADLLDACNTSKNETLYFSSDENNFLLVESIIKTLNSVFLYDSQNFVNKERFETIMQPLVDQLENELGDMEQLKIRAKDLLIPCISQFAVATADDSLWKPLNYQILLKTRHNDSNIRLLGLQCMTEVASKLGDSWLPLLPESVPFLAELLEDEVKAVEEATQKSVQVLEAVLGEPLQKYF